MDGQNGDGSNHDGIYEPSVVLKIHYQRDLHMVKNVSLLDELIGEAVSYFSMCV